MKKSYNSPEDFYEDAMISINHTLGSKLRTLGVTVEEIGELVNKQLLNRYTSEMIDGTVLEMYEYNGIRLLEVEWTKQGVKIRDINKDERDIRK